MISFKATSKLRHDSVRGGVASSGADDVVVGVALDDADGDSSVATCSSTGFTT